MGRWLKRVLDRTAFVPAPVVTDNYLHLGFALLWLTYAMWGLATIATDLPSLSTTDAPTWYLLAWKAAVALAAGVAAVSALFHLERTEFGSVAMFGSLLASYFTVLIVGSITTNENYAAQAVLALSFLVMPLSRLRFLAKRIRGRGQGQ